tara:strand:+ start:1215 stop:1583 length:369 start_codon:yes stop_codon:yes gene_type:complete
MLNLEKIEIDTDDAQRDQIARLEAELAALKDKHNRFTGMIMAAMSDEIKVMISGEVSEQLANISTDFDIQDHMDEIREDIMYNFDIGKFHSEIEEIVSERDIDDEVAEIVETVLRSATITVG